jgi:hypothetical protein
MIGPRGEVVSPEIQSNRERAYAEFLARIAAADARLDEETRAAHPAITFAEMTRLYPDAWVVFHQTNDAFRRENIVGRVFDHTPNAELVDDILDRLYKRYSGVGFGSEYTGDKPPMPKGRLVLVARWI